MGADLSGFSEVLRRDPVSTAILLDFDGTLAPIVEDPELAVPLAGVAEVLSRLSHTYAVVAVVSGRPVRYLQAHLPGEAILIGLYGLEEAHGDEVGTNPDAERWRGVVDEVAAAASSELPPGVRVEHKGLSLTLHVRAHPGHLALVDDWARAAADRSGLVVRRARMSAELHPPVAADKGTVVDTLVAGLSTACFIGDDVGDLPAFDALDRFAAAGGSCVRFVVESDETDASLRARADALLAGPTAVLGLLRALAP